MKLNYKRTFFVGLAFMSICAFWQLYNYVIPLILKYTFHVSDDVSGYIMAADNILALFLLPLFGTLSDKTRTRLGKRTPFILFGTASAVILMTIIPLADWAAIQGVVTISDGAPGLVAFLSGISASLGAAVGSWNANFVIFIVGLGLLLLAMSTYRSPAVALMPDVTPKPLRSKANAVINLMGALGGIFTYLIISVLLPRIDVATGTKTASYSTVFAIIGAFMAVAAIILPLTVRENKLVAEMPADEPDETEIKAQSEKKKVALEKPVLRSLIFILLSVALWYTAYNAVETAYSRYVLEEWGVSESVGSTMMIVAMLVATVSYIPVGIISSKLGRKRVIIGGVILMGLSFLSACFITQYTPLAYVIMALIGVGWASINVNSFPMVVEMSRGSDIGKYTGYYYAFSMAAQIITPILSGYLFKFTGSYDILFPYAVFFCVLALITMIFVRHGDNRPEEKKDLLESFDVDD